ncbi:MAG: flagellar biosynthesis protein FlgH [Sideroxydans sp.]|nr:flagellar biosynthesis protein FlgH [Sideroxydans sp.]
MGDLNIFRKLGAAGFALVLLAGCTPSTSIRQPMTARPPEQKMVPQNNGAIYQAGINERPLFEDIRARNVGDTLTITLVENTSATQKNASNANHSSSVSANTPSATITSTTKPLLKGIGIAADSANKLANASDSSGSNVLSGTITVTVTEVLPNGNLLVSGEKQVSINQVEEYIRLSGVVRPGSIASGNTVPSTQVADARIEYKGANSNLDNASLLSMLGRFFLTVLPF